MFDIALAIRTEEWFYIDSKRFCYYVIEVEQIFSTAVRDVKRLTVCLFGSKTGLEVRFDHIFYVCEVPALSAVPVDCRTLSR